MGTMISLSLNGVSIDYGKNHYWTGHAWLFPPDSEKVVPYTYAASWGSSDRNTAVTEEHLALSAPLDQVRRRMDLLGHTLGESRDAYDDLLRRWNRTYALSLPFDRYLDVVASIDFANITRADQESFSYDIHELLVARFAVSDPQNEDEDGYWGRFNEDEDNGENRLGGLEDFIRERVPLAIMLRCMAERASNLPLPLSWEYHDLVDNGWEDKATLMEIDRTREILNLARLYGRLQEHSGEPSIRSFDDWLARRGCPQTTNYQKVASTARKNEVLTLPSAVRNMIHHPENRLQTYTNTELQQAVEELIAISLAEGLA